MNVIEPGLSIEEFNARCLKVVAHEFKQCLIDEAIRISLIQGVDFTLCKIAHEVFFGICDKEHMPEWFTKGLGV